MDSKKYDCFRKAPKELFGRPYKNRQRGTPLEVASDTSVWEIYNHEAEIADEERIKDWNASLNTLLIFAALYSAVLTAFIIESMKLLQEDTFETTRAAIISISQQLANNSLPAYQPSDFSPPSWAVAVNYFFFISLSCSLVTALAAVLALQWVGSFDRGLSQSSPEDRALQRQFRDEGIRDFRIDQIIAFLPVVIFFSLFTFFIGLAEWLWFIHHGVAAIVMTGVAIGALLFWVTTFVGMVSVRAPFRTPLSRSLPIYLVFARKTAAKLLARISPGTIKSVYSRRRDRDPNEQPKGPHPFRLLPRIHMLPKVSRASLKSIPSRLSRLWPSFDKPMSVLRCLYREMFCPLPFDEREKAAINSVEDIRLNTLLSLSTSLSVVPHQKNSFLILIQAFLDLRLKKPIEARVNKAPWGAIFTILCQPYFNRRRRDDFSDEELAAIAFLLGGIALIARPESCDSPDFETLYKAFWSGQENLARMFANLAFWRHLQPKSPDTAWVFESFEYAVRFSAEWPVDAIANTLACVKAAAGPLDFELFSTLSQISTRLAVYHPSFPTQKPVPLQAFDVILDIASLIVTGGSARNSDPIDSFVESMERHVNHAPEFDETIQKTYIAVIQTLSVHLRQATKSNEANLFITRINKMVRSNLWKKVSEETVEQTLLALANTSVPVWDDIANAAASLLAQVVPDSFEFDEKDWGLWWFNMVIGFGQFEERRDISRGMKPHSLLRILRREIEYNQPSPKMLGADRLAYLGDIKSPHTKLLASAIFRSAELAISALHNSEGLGQDRLWYELIDLFLVHIDSVFTEPNIHFLRDITLTAPPQAYLHIRWAINHHSSDEALAYFQSPVLGRILQSYDTSAVMTTLKIISTFPWFITEMMAGNGPLLMPWSVFGDPRYLEEALNVIYNTLPSLNLYQDITIWIKCVETCLIMTGVSLNGSTTLLSDTMAYARRFVHSLTTQLQGMIQKLKRDRAMDTDIAISTSHPLLEFDEDDREGYEKPSNVDGRTWSVEEWEELQATVDEVIPGLQRGYIMVRPSADWNRFARDPEGVCAHAIPLEYNTTASSPDRKGVISEGRYPLDPDGLCMR